MVTHTNTRRRPNDNGFTTVELIVVITVIGLLATLAVGAYNKVVSDAKIAKSKALISTFVSDPQTVTGSITAFNAGPDANFTLIAPYIRVNGAQPASESDLLSLSGMPSGVTITLGTVDDSSLNGGHTDQSPTVTGYGL